MPGLFCARHWTTQLYQEGFYLKIGNAEERSLSKLILTILLDRPLYDGGTEIFHVEKTDIDTGPGDQVIIASTHPSSAAGYIALGVLEHISQDVAGKMLVHIAELRLFPETLTYGDDMPPKPGLAHLPEPAFGALIDRSLGGHGIEEAAGADSFILAISQFTRQLSRQRQKRCSFSDVTTSDGVAVVIQPLDEGGALHASNFLFLDPEPGALFERFAWTVGPRFEIIVNMHAMRPDIADTVNRTGLLALSDDISTWPDRNALTWHREQFLARLSAGYSASN